MDMVANGERIDSRPFIEQTVSSEVFSGWEKARNPALFLQNTRTVLHDLSVEAGRPMRLIDVPDEYWKQIAAHYDGIWFMGIYQRSPMAREDALKYQYQYKGALPDVTPDDVIGSPFAVYSYTPAPEIAKDWAEWDMVYHKLHTFGLHVFLDFVPNHVALDHPWVHERPNFFIRHPNPNGTHPDGFYRVEGKHGLVWYIAHGRDPYFPPWFDTVQLHYANPEVQRAMIGELASLVPHCDGVRCDMAGLMVDTMFYQTWGNFLNGAKWPGDFWRRAIPVIKGKAKKMGKDFTFIAESYWDYVLDRLVDEGFDAVYEKGLYDTFLAGKNGREIANTIRTMAGDRYRHVVFEENHDEPRALGRFGPERSRAIFAVLAGMENVILLVHQGQEDGRLAKMPVQIKRLPIEPLDPILREYYHRVLAFRKCPLVQHGIYSVPEARPSGWGNTEFESLVCQQYDDGAVHAIEVANVGSARVEAHLPITKSAREVSVYSFNTGEFLPNETIAMPNDNGLYVMLDPGVTQVIYYAD